MFSKDKEEEIMEKITNIYNSGEENISVRKAIETLDNGKKQLVTTRKLGELDLLREKRDSLKEEVWEGYKLAEENIENEEDLLKKKKLKEYIKEQTQNLDLYKKYMKKVKLQDDYKEITEYLRKGEELRKKEEDINIQLKKSNQILTQEFLEEVNKEYTRYLSLADVRQEKVEGLYVLEEALKDKNKEFKDYQAFKDIEEDNIKEKVYVLKIEQENLKEKINMFNSIENSIEQLKKELKAQEMMVGDLKWFSKYRSEIDELTTSYKDGLKELKYKIETQSDNYGSSNTMSHIKKKIMMIYILSIIGIILLLFGIIRQNIPMIIILIPIFIFLIKFYLKYYVIIKSKELSEKNAKDIKDIKQRVDKDERKLNLYIEEINCKSYEQFIKKVTKYDSYKNYEENIILHIKKRTEELNNINFNNLKQKYDKNESIIFSLFKVFGCKSLQEILDNISIYEKLKKELLPLEYEINVIKSEIKTISVQLQEREDDLRKKTVGMGMDNIDILDFHIRLKEYKEKINQMQEIKSNLSSIEETYKVLLKDRDINEIKEEMKELISNNIEYSYQSDEEIDKELRKKSEELLKVEKEIKDLEHSIEKIYLGKRELSTIEEEVTIIEEKINKGEKEFKALELASCKLQEAFGEVRKNVGPQLNSKVLDKFNFLTLGGYREAKISEDYKLKVRNDKTLFDGDILSNGARDQLYLSLRLSFIEMLFNNKNVPIFLDDAFVQYDDERREKALMLLINENFNQTIFFTCQGIEENILDKNNIEYNLIKLS
ncbi:hypothetical protein SAMN05421842_102146 [Clostridium uliginosum]|uniref:DNA repair exonuclease SbcCD ATPase subunit n=2 Tax=Clostridium uliginosum TaxID=119641 RepID=A0A1I1IDK7_9CLOT|nr:hypothetical protein SAMN05421842_102146 [Clostridium uliginosum]